MSEYKPVIAINLCAHSGDDMFYIRRGYLEAIRKAGGLPVAFPLMADPDYAARVVEFADGVLLPGSLTDVDPKYYGAQISSHFGQKGLERDESDFFLLEKAFERKLPVFGICYGHQSLNVFCGGSLYQDIAHDLQSSVVHRQGEPYATPAHTVTVQEDSLLYRLYGRKELPVNSIHHQGVKDLGPSLKATAFSADGVIEGYENKNDGHFVLGVQWHPERMWEKYPEHLRPFEEFIRAAVEWRRKNR